MAKKHSAGKTKPDKSTEEKGLEDEFDGQATPSEPAKKGVGGKAGQKTEPDDEKHDDQDFLMPK